MRIKNCEIEEHIEGFVNSIYDLKEKSGWLLASAEEWESAVWRELCTWKTDGKGCCWESDENRFDGKEATLPRIRRLLAKRLKELAKEGIETTAYHQLCEK